VQAVAGVEGSIFANQVMSQQINIADRIEHFVLHKLIRIPQTVFIDDSVLVHDHRIIETATPHQTFAAQILELVHKAEGASTADFLDKGGTGKVDLRMGVAIAKYRVIKVDGERHLEASKGEEAGFFVAVFNRDRLFDANELLRRLLL